MTEPEKHSDMNELNDFKDESVESLSTNKSPTMVAIDSQLKTETVLLVNDNLLSKEFITPTPHSAVPNACTLSDFENKLVQKDSEINNLTRLVAKYERQLEKANKYNEDLRNQLSLISSELHKHRCRSFEQKSVDTQVTEVEIDEAYGDKPMPDWGTDSVQGSVELSIADSLKAVAEAALLNQRNSEEQTIEADSEYVFDSSTGLYYHPSTGYYWDPNYELFYDNTTGTYYKYNERSGEYEIHSQVTITEQSGTVPQEEHNLPEKGKSKDHKHRNVDMGRKLKSRRTARECRKKRTSSELREARHRSIIRETVEGLVDAVIAKCDTEKDEVGNLKEKEQLSSEENTKEKHRLCMTVEADKSSEYDSEESEESSGSLATGESELMSEPESGELISESSSSDVEMLGVEALPVLYDTPTEMIEDYPPCIRVIVQSSEHLKRGSLFIITCTGGSIGRDKDKGHAIELDDINASKLHAEIVYDHERHCYKVSDKGSRNSTILNGNRLSNTKSQSEWHDLDHDDVLQIGNTEFLLHIHKGNETCDSCEPGQVQAKLKAASVIKNDYVILSQEEKNRQRRRELKNIKKKYGLQNSYYDTSCAVDKTSDYCDKAHLRRKFIGSESEFFKQEAPASVQSPISAQNKGRKLLAKMGWKEGQGLGKTSTGIAEPINVELRVNQTAGLGSATDLSLSLDNVQHTGKAKRWMQARKRFENLAGNTREPPASLPGQLSSLRTEETRNKRQFCTSLPVHPSGSAESFSAASSAAKLGIAVLSPVTYEPTNGTNADTFTPVAQNSLNDQKCVQPTSQDEPHQHRPQMSWVSGGSEQIGLCPPPSTISSGDTEST